jgi:nucleolar protein 53
LARKLTAATTNAKAVTPEHPGCSFNPPKDAREDVVAVALAKEFKAKQARHLDPVTVPVSNVVAEANLVNELYFESGFGDDETDDEDGDGDGRLSINPAVNADKFTRTKRNKLKRRAEAEAIELANKKAKQLRRDLSNLKALNKEIEAEEEERQAKLARRDAVRAERRASQPARLGKLLHKEAEADVRFADELDGGSLRTLKPGVSLLRDRLKSYERREIIEPRHKIERKKAKAVMKYEPGARGEKEVELMAAASKTRAKISELRALVAANDRGAS